MDRLPIDDVLDELVRALATEGAVALRAPTGAGKTTRVPPRVLKTLDPANSRQVVVVEPRRVAARAAAARVAFENSWTLGREVGYRIRFEDRSTPSTRLLFVTEGVLLAWLQRDPFFEDVAAVVFDEFHERSLASDLALSMVEQVRETVRDDLWLVVMSATLESEAVSRFLDDCPIVESKGRLHHVKVEYLKRTDDRPIAAQAVAAVSRVLSAESQEGSSEGDVLVFLPGVGEIQRVAGELGPLLLEKAISISPLYGDLPIERQQAALQRSISGRRIVLATNVAETSVTVEGVTIVIDTGVERRLEVDPATGFDRLELRPISKRSARQRKGRAGRERPGRCLRLWTASQHSQRLDSTPPEVRRIDLAGPLLSLIAWGEAEPLAFPWFEAPDPNRAQRALELLLTLDAVRPITTNDAAFPSRFQTSRFQITDDGRVMATLGCHPRLGRLLLDTAREDDLSPGDLSRGARLAALLEERDVFRRPFSPDSTNRWRAPPCRSDALERLHALEDFEQGQRRSSRLIVQRARSVLQVAEQLERSVRQAGVGTPVKDRKVSAKKPSLQQSDETLLRALLRAFPDRLARRRPRGEGESAQAPPSDRAVLVGGRGVRLASSSGVRDADLFLALDVGRATAAVGAGTGGVHGSPGSGSPREALVFLASEVREEWLDPARVTEQRTVTWDENGDRPRATSSRMFLDLVLESKEVPCTVDEIETVLAAAAAAQPERFLEVDDPALEQLLARVGSLRQWRPELDLPELSLDRLPDLLPRICAGCRGAADVRKVRLAPFFESLLDWKHSKALQDFAPPQLELSNGTRGKLRYDGESDSPVLALRIQQLFGIRETPTVDGGRRPVLLHLLAPNQRPQQITTDLAGFWSGSYALVKKDLAGRYPKHPWPDDPASASPPRRRTR